MSETITEAPKKSDKFNKARLRKVVRPGPSEIDEFSTWVEGLGFQSAPKVHINGTAFSTAVVVVDFGTPLPANEPYKITPEQAAELIARIRATTKSLYRGTEVNVRVQSDTNTGVWWSSVG